MLYIHALYIYIFILNLSQLCDHWLFICLFFLLLFGDCSASFTCQFRYFDQPSNCRAWIVVCVALMCAMCVCFFLFFVFFFFTFACARKKFIMRKISSVSHSLNWGKQRCFSRISRFWDCLFVISMRLYDTLLSHAWTKLATFCVDDRRVQ